MCIIFEKNLSKTRNKINSTLTKIKKPTNYLPLFIFIQSLCKNIWKRSIFIFTNRFLISIIEYTFYHHPIINQTISLISLKKKKKKTPVPLFPYTHARHSEKNCPVTLSSFHHPLFALSYRAVQSDCNLINRPIRLPTSTVRFTIALCITTSTTNSSHSSRRMEHTPWQKVSSVDTRHPVLEMASHGRHNIRR